jgi:hypothetical protein
MRRAARSGVLVDELFARVLFDCLPDVVPKRLLVGDIWALKAEPD